MQTKHESNSDALPVGRAALLAAATLVAALAALPAGSWAQGSSAGGTDSRAGAVPDVPPPPVTSGGPDLPSVIVVPHDHRHDEKMAGGCWVRFYNDKSYRGTQPDAGWTRRDGQDPRAGRAVGEVEQRRREAGRHGDHLRLRAVQEPHGGPATGTAHPGPEGQEARAVRGHPLAADGVQAVIATPTSMQDTRKPPDVQDVVAAGPAASSGRCTGAATRAGNPQQPIDISQAGRTASPDHRSGVDWNSAPVCRSRSGRHALQHGSRA